jgi:hypothetical protein
VIVLLAACGAPIPALSPREPAAPDVPPSVSLRDRFVALGGDDTGDGSEASPWRTLDHALAAVVPGDRLVLGAGDWPGFDAPSGDASAWLGIGGQGHVTGPIHLADVDHVWIQGLSIGGFSGDDVSGLRVEGPAHHVALVGNTITGVTGTSAMGVTIYGGEPIRDLVIRDNVVADCTPAPSEAITVNGDVQRFAVTGNTVRDVDNIGIDVIGGEDWLSSERPSDGLVAANLVQRANSSYGDGAAAGIYVDGASFVVIERNRVEECDFGIEVGAENPGVVSQAVLVRSNVTYRNYKGGLILGGYSAARGRVADLLVLHNTLVHDGRPGETTRYGKDGEGHGEVIAQWAERVVVRGNVLVGHGEPVEEWGRTDDLVVDGNLDADPGFVDLAAGDLHLAAGSPAIDAGVAEPLLGLLDIDGDRRAKGAPDLGADER